MIGIISDIHGNFPALKSVLSELEKIGCKRIISLGDVAGYYCMINECIDLLKNYNVINIMGNHDNYLVNNINCERSFVVNQCINYQKSIITDSNLKWLSSSIKFLKEKNFWLVHGGWNNFLDEYIEDYSFLNDKNSKFFETNLFISGHTHVQKMIVENKKYVNPGSVGQPRDNNKDAGFLIVDDNKIELKRVPYDIDKIAFEMKKSGFEKRIYDCLYLGTKIQK